ncbi:rho GTPase-activating protein 23-like isoform X5 [Dermacentor andersoni]|uniref:rho GTPase-activating protein 23-like isoform X5 n=1 Tax=Dermacentor andersoni TaxID=34620 RepID=UPI002417B9EA|nr:rho GTPase-activating protein 21-like isoform X5 [Dermacentor andersoni]
MMSKGGEGDISSWTNQDQAAGKKESKEDKAWHGVRTVVLQRSSSNEDLGFTLRHFVVYPPDAIKAARLAGKHPTVVDPSWDQHKQEAMDTIFVREVQPGSAADRAGLVTGDRIVSINGQPVTGRSYAQVVDLIKRGGLSVQLLVVPKEDDILQLYFASAAYQPVRRPPWQTSQARPNTDGSSLLPPQRGRGVPTSEPTSPVHCTPSTHFRPVNPARRRFFGLDPSPPPAMTASASAASPPQGTTLGDAIVEQSDRSNQSNLLASQPMSLSYPSYRTAEVGVPRPTTSSKMPPSTSVPMHLGTQFLKPEDPWSTQVQADSGIGSVEDADSKQTATVTTTVTTTTATTHLDMATDDHSSLNLVAQRLHLFESGGLLARSLERMKLYRSELARLTSGCPVPIVSVRAAKFEEMDGSGSDGRRGDGASETSSLSAAPPVSFDRLLPLSSPTSRIPSFDRSPDSPIFEEKGFSSLPDQSTLARSNEGSSPNLDNGAVCQTDDFVSPEVASSVVYRRKNGSQEDKAHPARRTSYLRATANERLHLESDQSEDEQHSVSSTSSTPSGSHRIQRLKAFFGDKASNSSTPGVDGKNEDSEERQQSQQQQQHQQQHLQQHQQQQLQQPEVTGDVQGWLACKTVLVDGKRSSDRSWRPVWVVLKGDKVYILKDRKTIDFAEGSRLSVRTSMSDVARDYTKRKHVFRLRMESGTEYLFQADNHTRMMQWVDAFRQITAEDSEVEELMRSDQTVLEKAQAFEQNRLSPSNAPPAVLRPAPRKLALRHRSPTSGSPRVKSRRASLGDEPSLKAVHMWRGRVVHGWKKFHGSLASLPPKGHSIGVPLHECPPSHENQYVPWLVSQCCRVVEAKGLETVGVYRIPGNSAAVAALSATVNGTGGPLDLTDPRWGDVHVVSSLLKAFFRQLPDPLAGLYPRFIAAARVPQGAQRLAALRALVQELPVHNFETLKFLMQHLKRVVAHSETNKMEARNLAIVFGPTLVRTADNSMLTMITDMSHQCHITEALINYADYIFSPSDEAAVPDLPLDVTALSDTDSSVLLGNLHKVGGQAAGSNPEVSPRDLVSSLVSAANRKLRQRKLSLTVESSIPSTVGGPLKPGSRVKDKILAFEGKVGEDSTSKAASNGSLPAESSSPPPPLSAGSSSYPPSPTRTLLGSPPQTPSVCSEDLCSSLASGSASPRTYGQLSALAQQKVRHLEEETRAQLRASSRRCWPPPACPGGPAQREQIERDWQRAKQELEREDLLDFLADEPTAYLRLLGGGSGTQQHQRSSPVPFSPLVGAAAGTFFRSPQVNQASQASPTTSSDLPQKDFHVHGIIDDVHTPASCPETFHQFTASSQPMESPSSQALMQPSAASLFDSLHEKENIPQKMATSSSGGASCGSAVTYRCKKQCLNGASTRYAIYRVDDEAAGAGRPQQRHSENGVVAALVSRLVEGEATAPLITSGTRRRPLSSMGLQRRHTIGSSRDVKFHPFPSVRKVPSGQRTDDGGEWRRTASLRVASPV